MLCQVNKKHAVYLELKSVLKQRFQKLCTRAENETIQKLAGVEVGVTPQEISQGVEGALLLWHSHASPCCPSVIVVQIPHEELLVR